MTYVIDVFGDGERFVTGVEVKAQHPMHAVLDELGRYSEKYDLVKDLPMKSLQIVVKTVVEETQTEEAGRA